MSESLLKCGDQVVGTLKNQNGILFCNPAIVYRGTYSGRDILAKNSVFEEGYVDSRGYVPVEWWVLSATEAGNPVTKQGEGLTEVYLNDTTILFKDLMKISPQLFGEHSLNWPLTKVLDIGGPLTKTSEGVDEIPPIPCHVHAGVVKDGKMDISKGKLEAYYFPDVSVPPYNQNFGKVITRIGVSPKTTKEKFKEAMKQFGKSDALYYLLNSYHVNANEGWTVPPGIIHAPGPWTTFEIQRPQDDFNLLAWQLGKSIQECHLCSLKNEFMLKGAKDEDELFSMGLDWEENINSSLFEKYHHNITILDEGLWGKRFQIFFGEFYGEGWEVKPHKTTTREADDRPFGGIIWSGKGTINGNTVDVEQNNRKEFFIPVETPIEITSETTLIIFTIFPMKK